MVPLVELTAEQIGRIAAGVEGGAANVADIYPLAPLQEGMFFHHLMAGADGADVYLVPVVLRFDSRARLEEFLAALQQVIDRHDIYRTSVAWEGLPEPVQVVWRQAELPVTEVALAGGRGSRWPSCWPRRGRGWTWAGRRCCGCMSAAEPGTGRWLALLQVHHLVLDHTGLEVVLGEIAALLAGRGGPAAGAAAVP